jgi:hypothetical protein
MYLSLGRRIGCLARITGPLRLGKEPPEHDRVARLQSLKEPPKTYNKDNSRAS